ncbi:vacuolating cyotoxin family protein [Helicobacter sp. 11S03491-1]|uniref:vacuolating cyotoxin family protein n=1 Tax=Helicobacter sp. 11S03491-1 TaxID=1476196 RepID=UPI000BA7365E|nr:vacuolating cyotoxin family protein [Helicobacter sp. 11S03491-1]PAF41607.1 hypothetical protein BKH45_06820 [Helicobacter sp. 11S03491-1]
MEFHQADRKSYLYYLKYQNKFRNTAIKNVKNIGFRILFLVFITALLSIKTLYGLTNVTSNFTSLASGSWNDDGVVNGWAGYSTYTYSPTYSFGNHTLTFQGHNSPSDGRGGGYVGKQYVTINAGKVILDTNSDLKVGSWGAGNAATITFNAPVSMNQGSSISITGSSAVTFSKGLSGTGAIYADGSLNVSTSFQAQYIRMGEGKTVNALGVGSGQEIQIETLTNSHSGLLAFYTSTLDTHAKVTLNMINISNYGGGRSIFVNTHGYGDIVLNGPLWVNGSAGGSGLSGSTATFKLNGKDITFSQDVRLGYYNKLIASGEGSFNAKKIYVGGGVAAGGDSILDFQGMKGSTTIQTLELITASIYGKNFNITNLIEHKGASRSVFYTNIGTSTIGTLTLDVGGSNADNTILEFRGGGDSLHITTADIKSWAILDASKINKLTIDTLKSSYATIQAKELVLNNADFSDNKTYLYADTTTSNGTISLNNGAELWLKSGQSFSADTLNMDNNSKLYAASNNGGMSGATTIKHILFNNSQIYANNLMTDDITIKNNASVFLSNGSSYTNRGDLNIADGSSLGINGGDFVNDGKLNIILGDDPAKNAQNLINVLNGSFTFDMTQYDTGKKDPYAADTNTTIKAPKAQINVSINPVGIEVGKTYNLLTTANGIKFKDNNAVYDSNTTQYNTYKAQLNQRIFFNTTDGSPLAVKYWMSDDDRSIGFLYDNGKHYVDATPFIKPGVWVFGIGQGSAAFGSIGGIPGASGLAKDYTLVLQAQKFHNNITNQDENTVYYLQNLSYNNYGNRSAKFTIDASGSDFALGKNQDIGGTGGVVNIGPYNAKSTMLIKAENIFLGGTINLGDGGLISGHLELQSNGKVLGDDPSSVINIKNHSGLKAIGGNTFQYAGIINLSGNQTVTDEVGLDLSAISGSISIGTLNATAARPNSVDPNAGIKMKNFVINNLKVYNGNGGLINNFYSEFTTNIGTSTIKNLTLVAGTSGLNQSGLIFSNGGEKLTIERANIGSWSFLDASKITDTVITKELDLPYSGKIVFGPDDKHGAMFHNLTLEEGAVMNYGGSSDLSINGNFLNQNALINITPNGNEIKPVSVKGNATFYFDESKTNENGKAPALIKVNNVNGLNFNQTYTLFEAGGTITYIDKNVSGKEISSTPTDNPNQDQKATNNLLYSEMADRILLLSNGKEMAGVDISVDNKKISFIINENDLKNPYDPNDIRYWFYKKGGQEWINKIDDTGSEIMPWFQTLMIDKHSSFWAKNQVLSNDLGYFIHLGNQLKSTINQLSSVSRKNNSTAAIRLATDVSKTNRLVKLSSTQSDMPTFADMLRELKGKHFADAKNNGIGLIYKYANRSTYKNNLWATAIGAASFVDGGNSTLYGVNVGYDRFINNVIVGGYVAYAQGEYTGDIIRNRSYNANAGFYTRAYVGDSEFDFSISETVGINKEKLYSQEEVFQPLNQKYHYETYTTNINLNYGYVFGINDKSIVLKPQIGLSYYFIGATKFSGDVFNPSNEDLRVQANADKKQDITLNLAVETRQYLNHSSYWYFIAGVSRDLFLKSKGDQEVRFIGNNTLSYKKGDGFNTYGSVTAGGEMELFRRIYINLGLGAKAGIAYKDININGNVGMRYVF